LADAVIALNRPSLDAFGPVCGRAAALFVNSSLIDRNRPRDIFMCTIYTGNELAA
jgi:hypothetical protein